MFLRIKYFRLSITYKAYLCKVLRLWSANFDYHAKVIVLNFNLSGVRTTDKNTKLQNKKSNWFDI